MVQIDDFFMYENRVEGITDADYQWAQPYVEAAQAFAQTTYQSIYIIDYYVSVSVFTYCHKKTDQERRLSQFC